MKIEIHCGGSPEYEAAMRDAVSAAADCVWREHATLAHFPDDETYLEKPEPVTWLLFARTPPTGRLEARE